MHPILTSSRSVSRTVHAAVPGEGFSLIEIVVALGVISFALVGIMGLFPAAMKSALESQRETRATLIAQQIYSDLRSGTGTNAPLTINSTGGSRVWTNLNLSTPSTTQIYYSDSGNPVGTSETPSSLFLVTISVAPDTPAGNLSRVQSDIETPVAAPANARSRYTFVTLMNHQAPQ